MTHMRTRHFIRHYVEMVVAMFAGMIVLGLPAEAALQAMGTSGSALQDDLPALMFIGMATTMTVPMVAWMRYRGHGWQPSLEMAAAMFLPTFAVIGLLGAGVVTDIGTLYGIEHIAMFAAMAAAMLLRLDEYTGAAHGHRAAQSEVAA
jgi:hypothetical protein